MSDFPVRGFVLAPSRASMRLQRLASAGAAALVPVLLLAGNPPARWSALACAVACAWSMRQALRPQVSRYVTLCPAETPAPGQRQGDSGTDRAAGRAPRAEFVSATRIVLRLAHGRLVIWRDGTDPDTFRRLAVQARWCGWPELFMQTAVPLPERGLSVPGTDR